MLSAHLKSSRRALRQVVQRRYKATAAAVDMDVDAKPQSAIPVPPGRLPIIGDLRLLMSYKEPASGTGRGGARITDFTRDLYDQLGEIYQVHLPGMSTVVVNSGDFLQVFNKEGKYPIGAAEDVWPLLHYTDAMKQTKLPLLDRGERWRETRHTVQPHVFAHGTAKSFLPHVNEATRHASATFPNFQDRIPTFTQYAAFDMFSALTVGKQMRSVEEQDEQTMEFCNLASLSMFHMIQCVNKNWPKYNLLKPFSEDWKLFKESWERTMEIGAIYRNEGLANKELMARNDTVLAKLMNDAQMDKTEVFRLVDNLLIAGVDTTAFATRCLLANIANNPDKQQILREELQEKLNGGDLNKDVKLPYLKACIAESNRVSPTIPWLRRVISEDMVMCGHKVEKGTMVTFSAVSLNMNEDYVGPNPEKFDPARYLPEASKARRGTPAAIVDHPISKTPFSFGARMCLGARLANLEMESLVARLVQDYRFSIDPSATEWKQVNSFLGEPHPYPKFVIEKL